MGLGAGEGEGVGEGKGESVGEGEGEGGLLAHRHAVALHLGEGREAHAIEAAVIDIVDE